MGTTLWDMFSGYTLDGIGFEILRTPFIWSMVLGKLWKTPNLPTPRKVWKTHSSHENRHFEVCRIPVPRFHPFPVGFKSLGCAHLAPQVASKRMWRCWIELCSWPRCRAVEGHLPRPWRFSPHIGWRGIGLKEQKNMDAAAPKMW